MRKALLQLSSYHIFRKRKALQTIVLHPPNVTSVLRYFGPTRTWFFSAASSCCQSDILQAGYTLHRKKVSVSDYFAQVGCTVCTFCGSDVNICMSDSQHQQVGCTTLVCRMRIFSRSIKVVHPTCKSCASDLLKLCIRHTKVVHPTYKLCISPILNLCIRPTKSVHPTYKSCASDLQKVCI